VEKRGTNCNISNQQINESQINQGRRGV